MAHPSLVCPLFNLDSFSLFLLTFLFLFFFSLSFLSLVDHYRVESRLPHASFQSIDINSLREIRRTATTSARKKNQFYILLQRTLFSLFFPDKKS
ncbi:hypothetical protein CPB86DRAFT_214473 [Serendipita vermifera]|nr:hypothetical protein CPB86DRAFT_214473 [Serendipita vermifera]